jgi:pilus assembly protein CpaE
MPDNPDSIPNFLFVALIVPDPPRRRALAAAISASRHAIVREFDQPMLGDLSVFARLGCDVAIVDLDNDIDQAVGIIESICLRNPSTTVMACSARSDLALARRAMQAGARDYLAEPVYADTVKSAFDRISSHRTFQEKAPGKLLVFVPSKRGVGVTSIASNFAVSLTRESGGRVVIVDLDLQLGDVALGLGLTASCSVVDALKNPDRFDLQFLSSLLVHHNSGLDVLGSPEDYSVGIVPDRAAADKVFQVLLGEFDYVVVDSGTSSGEIQESLFGRADKLYLVTELSFPAVRNAHRMMSYFSVRNGYPNLEVVLNRFDEPHGEISEDHLRKAVGRPADWKIPHGRAAAVNARNTGVPLAMENSPVAAALTRMAKAACGKPLTIGKPSRLFGFLDPKARPHHSEI